jgi:hypothetical protein
MRDGYRFFPEMSEKRLHFQYFYNIIEFILFLSGRTASVKRIFYIKNTYVVKGDM